MKKRLNVNGQILQKTEFTNKSEFSIQIHQEKGIYILKINTDKQVRTYRLIVQY